MSKARYLVAGATGLIGRSVTQMLIERGDEVIGLSRQVPGAHQPHLRQVDLSTCSVDDIVRLGPFTSVLQLAQAGGWHSFPSKAGDIAAVNISGTLKLAEAAAAIGAKSVVFASSGGIYGPSKIPITEHNALSPSGELGFYLATKAAAERLLAFFEKSVTVHFLRPFFVYGPGQAPTFLIQRMIDSVTALRPVRIDGGRGPLLNPIHVNDAARAFLAATELTESVVANIAGPEVASIKAIAELVGELSGHEPIFQSTSSEPTDYIADISVMKLRLFVPSTDLRQGLEDTLRNNNKTDRQS